jgi:hypothetical protein
MRTLIRTNVVGAIAAAALAVTALSARQQGGPAPRDLSGFWELSYDAYSIPPADLAPAVTAEVLAEKSRADVHALRWCHSMGLPLAMLLPRPIQVRAGRREVYLVFEANAVVRHVYLNRSTHISADEWDPSTMGDSIGRWEGDTFVVETTGFHGGRGVTAIPGGGFRTDSSVLTERFRLIDDGAVLSVVSTWTDPGVFRTPHTYELRYVRLPDTYEPRAAVPCDAYDEDRIEFLEKTGGVSLPAANVRR